ncbi:subtilisin-like protease 4 [Malania oleifera]|uniref:subtilisin-like protease 4 n=1 Tax=Malania oleifera TaxID=397392 RepID=UPI0025AE1DCE|nr:subtilisin-like protease 4 [Malania oleifera]
MEKYKNWGLWPKMANIFPLFLPFMLSFPLAISQVRDTSKTILGNEVDEQTNLQTYIVIVKQAPTTADAHGNSTQMADYLQKWHMSFLPTSTKSLPRRERMVCSYRNVISGFAAKFTPQEVESMSAMDGFVLAYPERKLPLHTTHSPQFLGLHPDMGFWKDSNFGKGIIIGVMDTGIHPTHVSLNDEGVPPPPSKWKGKCEFNQTVCNNKLIGARNFKNYSQNDEDNISRTAPFDVVGHGTHTATTAAGNFVAGANVFGNANGTAAGTAPLAHLAIYKVCAEGACVDSDVLAAFDAALEDGVDILSLAFGTGSAAFFNNSIALGTFRAMQEGIFVSCSAGNSGPNNGTIGNEAPWFLTVGASTIDRSIRATVRLGNGEELDGESAFQPTDFPSTLLPLVYPGMNGNQSSALCSTGSLGGIDVKGKVVLCERGLNASRIAKGHEVKDAGGAAMVLVNRAVHGFSTLAEVHVLPAAQVSYESGLKIKAYLNSTSQPTATIMFKGTIFGITSAPSITSFSSRGPNKPSPGILKPDIIGPGVSILAAWPFSLEGNTTSTSNLAYNMISGTSMSCPHLGGVGALLKSSHPDWSPAAIKSAIMTSANVVDLEGKLITDETGLPASIFATGAGHVNALKANDPGLIYDIEPDDYLPYLCGLGYTDNEVWGITRRVVNCSQETSIPEAQLNYPSFSIMLGDAPKNYTRTVTNVGQANSCFMLEVTTPGGVDVCVKPDKLEFSMLNQKITYAVTFSRTNSCNTNGAFAQGFLTWVSGNLSVRSPISVKFE